ncbi:MAG: phosphatase PAP2 family protein [Candidatus Micrarchaeia archaeon]
MDLLLDASLMIHEQAAFVALVVLGIFAVALPLDKKFAMRFERGVLAVGIALVLAWTLKMIFAATRPCETIPAIVACPHDFSLPSIHTAIAVAIALCAIGTMRFYPLLAISVLIGASRIFIGVHNLNDVCAGAAVAVAAVAIAEGLFGIEPALWHGRKWIKKMPADEDSRQAMHLVAGLIVLLSAYYIGVQQTAYIVFAFLIGGLVMYNIKAMGLRAPILDKLLGKVERNGHPAGYGAVMLFSGMLACLTLFYSELALSLLFILAVGDVASNVFGRRFGKHRLPHNKCKSLEGTAAYAITSAPAYFIGGFVALIAAILSAMFESVEIDIDDNLFVPAAGVCAFLIMGII